MSDVCCWCGRKRDGAVDERVRERWMLFVGMSLMKLFRHVRYYRYRLSLAIVACHFRWSPTLIQFLLYCHSIDEVLLARGCPYFQDCYWCWSQRKDILVAIVVKGEIRCAVVLATQMVGHRSSQGTRDSQPSGNGADAIVHYCTIQKRLQLQISWARGLDLLIHWELFCDFAIII